MDLGARLVNDTIEVQPFWNSTRIEGSARFSPDGSRIAVRHRSARVRRRFGSPGATEADFSRSRHSALSGVLVGGWSPDGSQIAFEAAIDGNTDVYVVGRDGGHLRRLTTEPSMDGVPTWSADGRWIYFASTRAGASRGRLAGLFRRKPSHPTDTQRRLRAAGISGRPVPLLSRPSSCGRGESVGPPG